MQISIVRCKFWTLQICSGDSFLAAARYCQKDKKKEPIPHFRLESHGEGSRGHDDEDDIYISMYPKILCMWVCM